MTLETVRTAIQSALGLNDEEAAAITLDTTPATVRGWTSQTHLELILALERQFDVVFDANQIAQSASVAAIVKMLDQRTMG
jgi:acyl carrier protein